MNDVKILIVDDEILIAEDLKDTLFSLGYKRIALAHDKKTALTLFETFNPDIALLDIRMEKELDGLEIGEYINEKYQTPFIYITAHSDVEMIKKIVKTKPTGYITKPFKKSDLFANVTLAIDELNAKPQTKNQLIVKDGYDNVIIDKNSIDYIETEGNYITIYHGLKKTALRQTLDSIFIELDSDLFIKIHRCYIVNLNKVTAFSKKDLHINDIVLPISKNILTEFEERIKLI